MEKRHPHSHFGLHTYGSKKLIRLWRPDATEVFVEVQGKLYQAKSTSDKNVFEFEVPQKVTRLDYRVYYRDGRLAHDPYAFVPTFGEVDAHLFSCGVHYKIYEKLGGRLCEHQGVKGAKFAVWAPNALSVSLIGDFNGWDSRQTPMRLIGSCGVWEIFMPGLNEGELYKFEIETQKGVFQKKSDPYAYFAEVRPKTASRLFDVETYSWADEVWLKKKSGPGPMNIYEVHLGSWRRGLGYRELAHELAIYCQEMGFSHVELMPMTEHPLDESWGYQVTGFYAVTSRFGTPKDFQYFVNHLHAHSIGIIIDWVPAHFPADDFALAQFDGTCLYEYPDSKQNVHPHWNTLIFNYGRKEVTNFLIGSLLFWLDKMHVDGVRVDAVASMLYLDYGRSEGEWVPNREGGKENLEALEFLKHLNSVAHERFPGRLICAEESTSFPGITSPLDQGGVGFDLKWNMGWMNDTLRYFKQDLKVRSQAQRELTFGLLYAFSERFILVFSHDEVVHEKASLISKMPGNRLEQFAGVRLFYSYMICQPGKKLLFMGSELGQWEEWNSQGEIAWNLLQFEPHRQLKSYIQALNHFYHKHGALWEKDFDPASFKWVDFHDAKNSVISYLRFGKREKLLIIHAFTPQHLPNYFIALKGVKKVRELFNTDREEFGGSGKLNSLIQVEEKGITLQIPPLATLILEVIDDIR